MSCEQKRYHYLHLAITYPSFCAESPLCSSCSNVSATSVRLCVTLLCLFVTHVPHRSFFLFLSIFHSSLLSLSVNLFPFSKTPLSCLRTFFHHVFLRVHLHQSPIPPATTNTAYSVPLAKLSCCSPLAGLGRLLLASCP